MIYHLLLLYMNVVNPASYHDLSFCVGNCLLAFSSPSYCQFRAELLGNVKGLSYDLNTCDVTCIFVAERVEREERWVQEKGKPLREEISRDAIGQPCGSLTLLSRRSIPRWKCIGTQGLEDESARHCRVHLKFHNHLFFVGLSRSGSPVSSSFDFPSPFGCSKYSVVSLGWCY